MLPFNQLSFWEKRSYFSGVDIAIIGAGIVGMTTALNLKKRKPNLKILVIERGYLPSGASTKNAGFACFGSPSELKSDLARQTETEVWDTLSMRYEGLKKLFELVSPETMGYKPCGSWDLLTDIKPISEDFLNYLNGHLKEISGENRVYFQDHTIIENFGFQGFDLAYKNRLEGSIETDLLMDALYAQCIQRGVKFLFNCEVLSIENLDTSSEIDTQHGTLKAERFVFCTNGFAAQLLNLDVEPGRAQVLVTRPLENLRFQGTFHFDEGYYYFRNVGNRVLLGGGRNKFKAEETTYEQQPTEIVQQHLLEVLQTNILPHQTFEIQDQWAGTLGLGLSKTPIIESFGENAYIGVRMGGMGIAIGAMVAEKLSNLIMNNE
jgi:glycine/D-amino acid oxidase-like deaminating enzyme